jgi:hypothetical protein
MDGCWALSHRIIEEPERRRQFIAEVRKFLV